MHQIGTEICTKWEYKNCTKSAQGSIHEQKQQMDIWGRARPCIWGHGLCTALNIGRHDWWSGAHGECILWAQPRATRWTEIPIFLLSNRLQLLYVYALCLNHAFRPPLLMLKDLILHSLWSWDWSKLLVVKQF